MILALYIPGLLFLVKKVVIGHTLQGFLLLLMVYTAGTSLSDKLPQHVHGRPANNNYYTYARARAPKTTPILLLTTPIFVEILAAGCA